jgi:hypothetical protein
VTASELRQTIAQNYERVRESIASAADGREIRLVAITKYARPEWVPPLIEAGATELGENLLPQAAERFADFEAAGLRFTRHLVGPPQGRKVKLIPGNFDMVQAVERMKTAQRLEAALAQDGSGPMDILLQVNIGGEDQKSGLSPAETPERAAEIAAEYPHLRLRGLMAIPPAPDAYTSEQEFERGTRSCFRQMREIFDRIAASQRSTGTVDILSLGMSADYVWAIEEGATMVRVGSALFADLERDK